MALRTNSKKARENVRAYIFKYITPILLEEKGFVGDPNSFEQVARFIYEKFSREKNSDYYCRTMSEFDRFDDWASGLPLNDFFLYYAYRSAVSDLGDILEETEEELSKYRRDGYDDKTLEFNWNGERMAEILLTKLIYNEIIRAIKKEA